MSAAMGLSGCGGSSTASATSTPALPAVPLAAGGATSVYVIAESTTANSVTYSVLQLPATANGSVLPTSILNLPANFYPYSLTIDSSGQLYAGGYSGGPTSVGEVLIYASGASGSAAPLRTITGVGNPASSISPHNLCVDSTGLLYVALSGGATATIEVFASTANGAATPLRTIQSGLVISPFGLATDASQNVYLSGTTSTIGVGVVAVYSSSASGSATPIRTITGNVGFGIAVDAAGDLYAMWGGIVEFAPGASGAATPLKTISGSATEITSLSLAVDKAGNVYSLNIPLYQGPASDVTGFGPSASGNVAPSVYMTSSSWSLVNDQVAVY